MIKSFSIRLYPTKFQEQLMWKHINCCRYIYNWLVAMQMQNYKNGGSYLSQFQMINLLPELRRDQDHIWLQEVSLRSLQIICADVNFAFQMFFSKLRGYPRFKSKKKAKPGFPVDSANLWFNQNSQVNITKIGKIKYKTDFILPKGTHQNFKNPRIHYKNNKWILSFGRECESQVFSLNDYSMGIDLGVKDSAVVAYNTNQKLVFHNINKSDRVQILKQRIKCLQKSISRKYELNKQGSHYQKTKNIQRQENKLCKLYDKISNIRNNFIHQSTHFLVSLLPAKIVMEDLNISGMMKNKHLSSAIQEQCFYKWITYIKYKCQWRGIEFIQVPRRYPSSKTCHNCGTIKTNLSLKDRVFICPECGYVEDRDYNAALNLMSYKD